MSLDIEQWILFNLPDDFDLHDEDALTRGNFLPEAARVRNHGDRLFRAKNYR